MQLQARTIVELVERVEAVRTLTSAHPELKSVAQELLSYNAPLPRMNGHRVMGRKRVTSAPRSTHKPLSAAQRRQRSLAMKKHWAAVKKAGKNSL